VISIMLALIAVLLPALAGARAAARLVPCQMNLRQYLTASMSYAADFNDRVPGSVAFETAFSSGGNPSRTAEWHMLPARSWHRAPAPIVINMQRGYLPKDKDIAWCPDRPREEASSREFWSRGINLKTWGTLGTGYGVNGFRWGSRLNTPNDPYWQYRNGGAIHPVEWTRYHGAYYMTETAGVFAISQGAHLDPSLQSRGARHGNRLNVSFPDGRVEVFDYEALFKLVDTRNPRFCWGD